MTPSGATHFNPVTGLYYYKNGATIHYWSPSTEEWIRSSYPATEFNKSTLMEQL